MTEPEAPTANQKGVHATVNGRGTVYFDEIRLCADYPPGVHEPSKSRWYHGWYDEARYNYAWWGPTDFQKWTRYVWEELGDEESLFDALTYAINQLPAEPSDPCAPANAYRMKGYGSTQEVFLRD